MGESVGALLIADVDALGTGVGIPLLAGDFAVFGVELRVVLLVELFAGVGLPPQLLKTNVKNKIVINKK